MRISDILNFQDDHIREGDSFSIELDDIILESYVVGFTDDGIIIESDEFMLGYLTTDDLTEAKYHGKTVPLGKPMAGDVKKSKVFVKKPNGKVVKVNFGDKNMRIKKSNPKRRKSFRARHHCENPGPRWKARYWSCRKW
jgi:hypothetical protein